MQFTGIFIGHPYIVFYRKRHVNCHNYRVGIWRLKKGASIKTLLRHIRLIPTFSKCCTRFKTHNSVNANCAIQYHVTKSGLMCFGKTIFIHSS